MITYNPLVHKIEDKKIYTDLHFQSCCDVLRLFSYGTFAYIYYEDL